MKPDKKSQGRRNGERALQAGSQMQGNSARPAGSGAQGAQGAQGTPGGWGGQRPKGNGSLKRALSYLGKHRRTTFFAYGALLVATVAQLLVPQMVQNMVDAVTKGTIANGILSRSALEQGIAAALAGTTVDQFKSDAANAETLLFTAAALIVTFAIGRGVFAFVQAYMTERTAQEVAYDLRNEIFAKIQRLSFSYHDQNQTGQ